ncbi:MAG: DUF6029 family protein [Crocinitomicaceae bacterium]|nr:DUF6029 family protein [Crocinitomicaceae bacterium]
MKKLLLCTCAVAISLAGNSQRELNISGNIESIFQYLNEDTLIGADQPAEKGLLNTYMNVYATYGGFKAGLRLESYLPRTQGYPNRFDGTGIGMRYIGYSNDFVDVTLGSFYEQFGSGMSFRAYEDRALGYDNLMDGLRLIVRPYKGVVIKGVYGYQRYSFDHGRIVHSPGITRGVDAEININSLFKKLEGKKFDVTIGGSFVSKYQADDNETYILPENVGSYGGRIGMRYAGFTLDGEYIIKEQDPSADNGYIYNYGHGALINFGYSRKGLGLIISAKSVDNMSYRSDRNAGLADLLVNYLPAMNKTHSYNLVASLYPYATQPLGEISYQAEILYTAKRKSWLGGKYGTSFNANFSVAYKPLQWDQNPEDEQRVTYTGKPFDMSDSLLWMDFNFNIYKKFSKKLNMRLSYFNISMNNDVNKITNDAHGIINTNVAVFEIGYKFSKKHSIRVELQGLIINKVHEEWTEVNGADTTHMSGDVWNDKGNWITLLLEYNFSPHWFFSVMDQYNIESATPSVGSLNGAATGTHYYYISAGYIRESTRISVGYGRQRAGLFCVGGVCRPVPASNGLTVSFTHSF